MRRTELLQECGVETEKIHGLPRWDTVQNFGKSSPSREMLSDNGARAAVVIAEQLSRLDGYPGGVAHLLLFVLDEVEQAWEVSYIFQPLWDTLKGARDSLQGLLPFDGSDDARATRSVLALMASLEAQIRAEDAMVSGLLRVRADAANEAVEKAREAKKTIETVPDDFSDGIRAEIVDYAEEYCSWNTALAKSTHALMDFYSTGESLKDAIDELRKGEEDDSTGLVVTSELRANRLGLIALEGHRDAQWLHIDHGNLVYIYPFAVPRRCAKPDEVVEKIEEAQNLNLAGFPARLHKTLELDDIWASDDPLGYYGGVFIEAPNDVLVMSLGGEMLANLKARVVVSKLGNHYVRFEVELDNVSADELHSMMFRAAPEAGRLCVTFGSAGGPSVHKTYERLCDLAIEMVRDLGKSISCDSMICRRGLYQVIVSVGSASTTQGPGERKVDRQEVLTKDELIKAMGAQLLINPVTSLMGSPAEWARYPTLKPIDLIGPAQECVVRTCNTTALITLGLPDFVRGTWGTLVEFAASLEGLLEGWSRELRDLHGRSVELKNEWESMPKKMRGHPWSDMFKKKGGADLVNLLRLSDQIDEERIRLNDFAVEVHTTTALISSQSFVASPAMANTLHRLLEISGHFRRLDQLSRDIGEISHQELGGTIEKLAQQRMEEERVRQAAKATAIIVILTAMGVSGLVQILEVGYKIQHLLTWILIGIVIVVAFLAAYCAKRWSTPSDAEDDTKRSDGAGNHQPQNNAYR